MHSHLNMSPNGKRN